MALPHNALPPDLQAAVKANLSLEALRGLMVLIAAISESVDQRHMPYPAYRAIAGLCYEPRRWAVVHNAHSPYMFVRAPIESVDLAIWTFDLRGVLQEPARPTGIPRDIWGQVRAAAKQYEAARRPTVDNPLVRMTPRGNA